MYPKLLLLWMKKQCHTLRRETAIYYHSVMHSSLHILKQDRWLILIHSRLPIGSYKTSGYALNTTDSPKLSSSDLMSLNTEWVGTNQQRICDTIIKAPIWDPGSTFEGRWWLKQCTYYYGKCLFCFHRFPFKHGCAVNKAAACLTSHVDFLTKQSKYRCLFCPFQHELNYKLNYKHKLPNSKKVDILL